MSLVLRRSKGSKLSSAEMDDNLLELSRILSGSDGTGVIQVTGSSLNASNTPITSSFFTGDGRALTNITASYLPGIDGSRLLNVTASYISPNIPIPVNGTNTQIQFNSGSTLSGSNNLVYNYTSQSLAHGDNNHQTIGLYSHAEGSENITLGDYSYAEGVGTRTGVYGYAINSVALNGSNTDITLNSSYSNISSQFGINYILINDVSANRIYKYEDFTAAWNGFNTIVTVIGVDLTSVFSDSDIIALSSLNGNVLQFNPVNADQKIDGDYSHTEGDSTFTINDYSHAEGSDSIAAGLYSHAEGDRTITLGWYSHTEGFRTIASGDYQLVVGQYNVASTSQSAFIIGDGTNSGRHNVLFVSKSHFEVSASNMYLQGLANSSQTYVVAIDATTGKLSYTLASGIGSLTPAGGNNTAIQFNSASAFSGSNNFTYDYTNNTIRLTGSILATTGFTGSLLGTASYVTGSIFNSTNPALSASFALSSSYVLSSSFASTASFVITASYVDGLIFTNTNPALTASHALTASLATTASYVTGSVFTSTNRALSASFAISSSRTVTASFAITSSYITGSVFTSTNPALSASYALTASFVATASYVTGSIFTGANPALTASYALFALNGGASTLPGGTNTQIQYNNNNAFDGVPSLTYSGSLLRATGSFTGSFIGSLLGTASWAESASQALTASFVRTAQTASYVLQAVSASFASTASYVTGSVFTSTNPALSASFALTSSFALTASFTSNLRAGSSSVANFVSAGGGDYISNQISLLPAFPNNNYAITVTGEDARSWTIQTKTNSSFVINTNSTTVLSGPVYWIAMQFNS